MQALTLPTRATQFRLSISYLMKGKLIVFEGCDGVGKSTLSAEIVARFQETGKNVLHLPFPGKTPGTLGALVYDLHHNRGPIEKSVIAAEALQCLHISAHLDVLERLIKPALEKGSIVILDRFWWSTQVYGAVSGANRSVLKRLIKAEMVAWGDVRPSHLFLIDRRMPLRDEPLDQWAALKQEYYLLAAGEAKKYPVHVLANEASPNEAADTIWSLLQDGRTHRNPKVSKRAQLEFDLPSEKQNLVADPNHSRPSSSACEAWAPLVPTAVLDTYWKFAVARQDVFFNRLEGRPPPWSSDPILKENKFTNAYRASDRVSQYLIRNVIYEGDQSPEELFFRTLLFKFFNKIETWELLKNRLSEISWQTFSVAAYDKILEGAISKGTRIYSAAYIMPTGGRGTAFSRKHLMHLNLLERMMREGAPRQILKTKSMEEGFRILRAYPSIGDFLAYQYITDLNYSGALHYDEMDFVVAGPGALDGISKCFSNTFGHSPKQIIEQMAKRQKSEFERLELNFRDLWGRPLQLIDCQNLFCEVSKYSRVSHPEITGVSGRTRIKQKFRATYAPIQYFYPPKWEINNQIRGT